MLGSLELTAVFWCFFRGVLVFQEVFANWKSSMLHKILLQFFILKDRQKSCWCRWCPISSTWYFMQSSMISPQRQNLHSTPTGEASLSSTPDSFVFNTLTKTCDLQEGFEKIVGWVWGEVAPNWGWRFGGLFIFKGIFYLKQETSRKLSISTCLCLFDRVLAYD